MQRLTTYLFLLISYLVPGTHLSAQFFFDVNQSVKLSATVTADPAAITLDWVSDSSVVNYTLYRRSYAVDEQWGAPLAIYSPEVTQYVDVQVDTGELYEYKVEKATENGVSGLGYLLSGVEVAPRHLNGRLLILLTEATQTAIEADLVTYQNYLRADGWPSYRLVLDSDTLVSAIKAAIVEAYAVNPFEAILILGDVPIPHSGDINPDAHNNHKGAWSADIYYGDLDGVWTDTLVNNVTSDNWRNHNVPGDGNWDQSYLPSDVEVAVGRVDFSEMPVFAEDEYQLLRNYLTKDINWRRGLVNVRRQGMVRNTNTWTGALGQNGIRNFSPIVSPDSLSFGEWSSLFQNSYEWYYGGSSGTYTSGFGLGFSSDYAEREFQSVFTAWFGSYQGDYDYPDAFLRAHLGSGTVLSSVWAGAPHWYFHSMGMGFGLDEATRVTQNNDTIYIGGFFPRGVHVNLLGDPTLDTYNYPGPDQLELTATPGRVNLSWQAAPVAVECYYIYRRFGDEVEFTLIDSVAANQSAYVDACLAPATYNYLVRASRLETTPSGSYYNLSVGTWAAISVTEDFQVISSFDYIENGLVLTFSSTAQRADSIRWILPNGSETSAEQVNYTLIEGSNLIQLIAINDCGRDTSSQDIILSSTTEVEVASFQLYPNPTNGLVSIKSLTTFTGIQLRDNLGRIVQERSFLPQSSTLLLVDQLPAGVYLLSLIDGNRRISRRLVIE